MEIKATTIQHKIEAATFEELQSLQLEYQSSLGKMINWETKERSNGSWYSLFRADIEEIMTLNRTKKTKE